MIVAGQALPLRRQSCPNLVQPLVTGRDIQFAVARDARQRACWMKDARNLASVALVKSVEVGLEGSESFDLDLSGIMDARNFCRRSAADGKGRNSGLSI